MEKEIVSFSYFIFEVLSRHYLKIVISSFLICINLMPKNYRQRCLVLNRSNSLKKGRIDPFYDSI